MGKKDSVDIKIDSYIRNNMDAYLQELDRSVKAIPAGPVLRYIIIAALALASVMIARKSGVSLALLIHAPSLVFLIFGNFIMTKIRPSIYADAYGTLIMIETVFVALLYHSVGNEQAFIATSWPELFSFFGF